MANETSLTSLNDLIAPIVQEALFVASESAIMPNLVRRFAIANNTGKVLQVPLYPTQSISSDVAEQTDLTNTEVSTNVANITLTEAGIMTTLTDMAKNYAVSNVVADLGKLFGEAIAKRHDAALIGKFGSFSASIGATSRELAVEDLFQAYATLKSNAVPGPYYGVFHPRAIYSIKKSLTNSFVNPNPSVVVNGAMLEGYIGRIAGIDIFETSNVTGTSAGEYINAVFSRDAIGLAVSSALKIETQRDASLRAEEIVATTVYGCSVLHDTYGVKIIGDATL